MMKSDEIMCVICNRPLSAQDQTTYGNRCEDCWCAGPSGVGDLRYSGGPYLLSSKETRGRPAHENPPAPEKARKRRGGTQSAASCHANSPTSDNLKSITNQDVKRLP